MDVIVPLAGPDFVSSNGKVKSLELIQGQPLIKRVLENRPWYSPSIKFIFILRDSYVCRKFYGDFLNKWFPTSDVIFLSGYTQGAAFSSLGGLTLIKNPDIPFLIDLADISFECAPNFDSKKLNNGGYGNGAFTFKSNDPHYSYLAFNDYGSFSRAVEKKVISDRASAGVYYFDSVATYTDAISWYIRDGLDYRFNDLFYVCPLLTGVAKNGKTVSEIPVKNILDIKLFIKSAAPETL